MKKANNKKEDWMQSKWRPMMAVMYMIVCIFDFIIFPIGFTIVQFWEVQSQNDAFRQWIPITMQGAGLFHMAMGAVLGITAWSRGQEKIAGVAVNNAPTMSPVGFNNGGMMNTNYGGGFNQTQATTYESSYTTVTPVNHGVTKGYGGKKAPPAAYEPEI